MRSDKNVHDIVTHLEWLSTLKDQSHYRLTLSSRLALLRYTRQCAVYQNQSVPEVVEQVLRSEPSCLFDGAAESVWDVRAAAQGCHRHRRHAGLQLPDSHHADGCGGECA